jgi:hypothetical protein
MLCVVLPCLFTCARAPGNIAERLILAPQFTLAIAYEHALAANTSSLPE